MLVPPDIAVLGQYSFAVLRVFPETLGCARFSPGGWYHCCQLFAGAFDEKVPWHSAHCSSYFGFLGMDEPSAFRVVLTLSSQKVLDTLEP